MAKSSGLMTDKIEDHIREEVEIVKRDCLFVKNDIAALPRITDDGFGGLVMAIASGGELESNISLYLTKSCNEVVAVASKSPMEPSSTIRTADKEDRPVKFSSGFDDKRNIYGSLNAFQGNPGDMRFDRFSVKPSGQTK